MRGRLVHDLQTGIVLENVQDSSVGLPEKLQPWCDDGSVCAVAGLLARDSGEEDRFGGLGGFEIFDILGG